MLFVGLLSGCGGQEFEISEDEIAEVEALGETQDPLSGCALDTAAESADVTHINNRRAAIGKNKLPVYDCVRKVARAWSLNMCRNGTISHRGNLANAIANNCGPNWRSVGENVGMGSTEASIWNAFMNSPAHKANIQGQWNRLGVGAYRAGNGTLFITQNFALY